MPDDLVRATTGFADVQVELDGIDRDTPLPDYGTFLDADRLPHSS
ncbi:hypothetical protein [Nocardia sp. alder85J]|nr:hypothetical protein [Nocardia sp. alder85J]MCX4098207.1 hypothetical protein [Nocardia sp. alder85J]